MTMMVRPGFIAALARSEWRSFWTGGAGGLAALVFLVLSGLWFYNAVADYSLSNMDALSRGQALDAGLALFSGSLSQLGLIIMLVTPLATMRAFTVFTSGGHLDLLLAWPLSGREIVLGHYLASLMSLSLLALLSLLPYLILIALGVGGFKLLVTSLLGFVLLISAFVSVGLAVSSLTRSPLASAVGTLGVLGVFWALGWAAPYLPDTLAALAQGLAFAPRLGHFTLGLLDINDCLYFLALSAGALYLTRAAED
jgi:ABC-2 type transport system permease protein